MNTNEEALVADVIGQLVNKIVQLKNENKQLRSQLQQVSAKNDDTSQKIIEQVPKKYIFGKATKETIQEYKEFVDKCISGEGKFEMSPAKVAVWMGISSRARDAYLSSLKSHTINNKPIIVEINGQYYSNFSKEKIFEEFFKVLD
jgi:hypothetical protein